MKYVGICMITILTLLLTLNYLLIPNTIVILKSTSLPAQKEAVIRIFINENNWTKLLSENNKNNVPDSATKFLFNNNTFQIDYKTYSSVFISTVNSKDHIKTILSISPGRKDSTMISWQANVTTSLNPIKRFNTYKDAVDLGKDLQKMLDILKEHYSTTQNIYGLMINKQHVKDSLLMFRSLNSKGIPSTSIIYSQINELKKYVTQYGANITGNPMLNITTNDSTNYLVKIALPIDKQLPENKEIYFRKMLGMGNILKATVTGGNGSINNAFTAMDNFIHDNHLVSPAIPFQSLVNDRIAIPDSNKWVTNIYFPYMYDK